MAKGRKKESSANNNNIESYKHEYDTLKNAVPVGLALHDTAKHKPKKYEYDPHIAFLTSTHSLPFKLDKEKRIAVKVIDHRGNEVVAVREIG
jgi:hypothetical protein